MPRFNDSGQIAAGGAGSVRTCWFDHARKGPIQTADGKLALSDGSALDPRGDVNYAYANGRGVWVASRVNKEHPAEVFGPGWSLPGAGLDRAIDPVGPDGSVAYKPDYFGKGPWGVRNADGSAGPTFGGDCRFVQNLGDGWLLWTEADDKLHSTLAFPGAGVRCWWPRYIAGHLLFQSAVTRELVLNGRVVAPPSDHYFRPDLFVQADGTIRIAWAEDEGESVVSVRSFTSANLSALPTFTGAVNPPQLPPPVSIPPQPVPNPGTPAPNPGTPPMPDIPNCKDILDAAWAAHPDKQRELLAASDAYEAAAKTHGANSPEATAAGDMLSDAKGWWCATFATACQKRDARFGQRKKTSGTRYKRVDGIEVSTDVIMWNADPPGNIIDVLSDRGYGWSINPQDGQPKDLWVAALPETLPLPDGGKPPDSSNSEPPAQTPPPPSVDLSAVLAQIRELKDVLDGYYAELGSMLSRVEQLQKQGMYGECAVKYLGTARVDLVPGKRPAEPQK